MVTGSSPDRSEHGGADRTRPSGRGCRHHVVTPRAFRAVAATWAWSAASASDELPWSRTQGPDLANNELIPQPQAGGLTFPGSKASATPTFSKSFVTRRDPQR